MNVIADPLVAADEIVVGLIASAVAPDSVSFGSPAAATDRPSGVNCYLLDLVPTRVARSTDRPPLQAVGRYLVTSWSTDASAAHSMLARVLVAVSDRHDLELEHDGVTPSCWQALGVLPQPALVVRTVVRWHRHDPVAPRVLEPARVDVRRLDIVNGFVVSPNGTPVARAEVGLAGGDGRYWTGSDGRFELPVVAPDHNSLSLIVVARGVTRRIDTNLSTVPLTIVFDPKEP
jgi:hypothetical protein